MSCHLTKLRFSAFSDFNHYKRNIILPEDIYNKLFEKLTSRLMKKKKSNNPQHFDNREKVEILSLGDDVEV